MVERSKKGLLRVKETVVSMPLFAKLCLLVLIALIPRFIVFLQPQIITNDGTLYIKMAKLFSEGNYSGIPGSYFSLYPFLIFLVQRLVGDWELSGQLISIVLGTLTVIPVFLLGRSLYDEKIGWLSAIFYITLPNLLEFDTQVLRDPTLWFFVLVTMWLVWEGSGKGHPLFFALASLSAGLGALTRVEGFVLWAALAFYIVFKKTGLLPVKRKILNLSLFVLIFPVLLSFVIFSFKKNPNQTAIGEMTSFSLTFIKAHVRTVLRPQDPIGTLGERTYSSLPAISQDALEFASRHRVVLAISEVIYKFFKSSNLLIILVLLGFWKRRKEGFSSSDKYLLYAFSILFLMSVFYARQLYYFSTRHGLTLVLPSIFFASHGLKAADAFLSQRMEYFNLGRSFTRRHLAMILTVFLSLFFLSQALGGNGNEKITIKQAGLWLKENGYRGSLIMGPKRFYRVAFYAEGRFVEMPDTWEKVSQSLHKNGVSVVVVDSCTIKEECPGFLENWPQAALFQVKRFERQKEKCATEIYAVP